jgi:hypothetical protein
LAYFSTSIIANRLGPAKPRAIAWNGAGGCVIVSQDRQLNFSRTCSVTNHCRGTTSSVSVTSLADLAELAAAAARARGRRRMNDAPARQIGGKVAPRPLAPREALHLDARRLRLRVILPDSRGQFLELQLHLVEKPLAALGARAKHLALHLGDHQLQVLDQRLGARELGARLDQRCLQRPDIIGQRIRCRRHAAIESQSSSLVNRERASHHNFADQPAAVGRHVCCGRRQSIPSSKYPS